MRNRINGKEKNIARQKMEGKGKIENVTEKNK